MNDLMLEMSRFDQPEPKDIGGERAEYQHEGIPLVGVTTALSMVNLFLGKWANELGRKGVSLDYYLTNTANLGKLVHLFVGEKLTNLPIENCPDFQPYWEPARQIAKKFDDFLSDYRIELIASERPLINHKAGFGGTLDILANIFHRNCRIRALADVKTSTGIFETHKMQGAAYRNLCDFNNIPIDKVLFISLSRDLTKPYKVSVLNQEEYYEKRFFCFLRAYQQNELQKKARKEADHKLNLKNNRLLLKELKCK